MAMRYRFGLLLILALGVVPGAPAIAAQPAWADVCGRSIAAAERHYGFPPGLLQSIALTESGIAGAPYPWTLNVGGHPVITSTYQEAAGWLRHADGRPRSNVAVGCMQVHMQYHRSGFALPEDALDPVTNVWYAALFLDGLHQRWGDWPTAIARYHAGDPAAQRTYLCRVASHLARTSPQTRLTLGLPLCSAAAVRSTAHHGTPAPSLFASRQAAGILVQR